MPLVSVVIPVEHGYQDWAIVVEPGKDHSLRQFLGDVVNFLILALALYFFIVKFLGLLMRSKQAAPPAPTKDQELLMEIRDLLKQQVKPA